MADAGVGLLAGIGQRFLDFCERFSGHFRRRTRTVEASARHDVRGLLQAETKNMERMEEAIPEADHQALHPRPSESAWPERAVLDPVAQDANRLLGGHTDSALPIDESGCPKKGTQSVGVARQWCGQWGKVENCQVGVFAALSRGTEATLIDGRLSLPEAWTSDSARCQAAGIPQAHRGFQRKTDLALAMIVHARQQGIGFTWVGFDGFYGSDPAFLRACWVYPGFARSGETACSLTGWRGPSAARAVAPPGTLATPAPPRDRSGPETPARPVAARGGSPSGGAGRPRPRNPTPNTRRPRRNP